jgi:hypothetical protein
MGHLPVSSLAIRHSEPLAVKLRAKIKAPRSDGNESPGVGLYARCVNGVRVCWPWDCDNRAVVNALSRAVELQNGLRFCTLRDAAVFILKLPQPTSRPRNGGLQCIA